eukprot:2328866-Alexandrium_andersonii.AAC.1
MKRVISGHRVDQDWKSVPLMFTTLPLPQQNSRALPTTKSTVSACKASWTATPLVGSWRSRRSSRQATSSP